VKDLNVKKTECNICGKQNLSFFNRNQFVLRKSTPAPLKIFLFNQGKKYSSHFYMCYNCCSGFLGKDRGCDKNRHKTYLTHPGRHYELVQNSRNVILKLKEIKEGNPRDKLIIKGKTYLTRFDFLDFRGGDVRLREYWFTLRLHCYGSIFIYDNKSRELVIERHHENIFSSMYKRFIERKMERIWEKVDEDMKSRRNWIENNKLIDL